MTRVRGMVRLVAMGIVALSLTAPAMAQLSPADLWPQATAALETSDIDGAEDFLTQMLDLGAELELNRFPLYAESAASRSVRQRSFGTTHCTSSGCRWLRPSSWPCTSGGCVRTAGSRVRCRPRRNTT